MNTSSSTTSIASAAVAKLISQFPVEDDEQMSAALTGGNGKQAPPAGTMDAALLGGDASALLPLLTDEAVVRKLAEHPAGCNTWRARDPLSTEVMAGVSSMGATASRCCPPEGTTWLKDYPNFATHAGEWRLQSKYVCTDAGGDGAGRKAVCRTFGFKSADNLLALDCCVVAAVSWGDGIKVIPVGICGGGLSPFLLEVEEYPAALLAQVEEENQGVFTDPFGWLSAKLKVPDEWGPPGWDVEHAATAVAF